MDILSFLEKYSQPTTTFKDLPSKNISAEKMRLFAEDISLLLKNTIDKPIIIDGFILGAPPDVVILTPNNYSKRKRYFIAPSAMPTTGHIWLYYEYDAQKTEDDILFDEFQVFFQAKSTGTIAFSTKGYDYYHAFFSVTANKFYKIEAVMLPKYAFSQDNFVWATLQEVAIPYNN